MGTTAKIIINMILDAMCLVFSVEYGLSKLPAETNKDKLVVAIFAIMAIYFIYSLVRQVVYLVKNR